MHGRTCSVGLRRVGEIETGIVVTTSKLGGGRILSSEARGFSMHRHRVKGKRHEQENKA